MDARQTLRAHIANLRRKIEPADGGRLIHTDHGVGYRLADVHPKGARRGRPAEEVTDREVRSAGAFPRYPTQGQALRPSHRAGVSWILPTLAWHDTRASVAIDLGNSGGAH